MTERRFPSVYASFWFVVACAIALLAFAIGQSMGGLLLITDHGDDDLTLTRVIITTFVTICGAGVGALVFGVALLLRELFFSTFGRPTPTRD
jgi:hypothetical protein